MAVIAALGIAPAADAAVTPPRSIEVAHGRDLVILDGFPRDADITVEVFRDNPEIPIAAATGYRTDGSGFLELNHVGGDDCFDGGTAPDIRPGDTIKTTVEGDDVDTMVVQHVTYDGAPAERMVPVVVTTPNEDPLLPPVETTVMEPTGIYEVTGLALTPEGTPLAGDIEVRLNHPTRDDWAATERRDWRVTAQADENGRYVAEFDTTGYDGGEADAAVIADAETSVLWLGSTSELSGFDGPGSPCPPARTSAITTVSDPVVNAAVTEITLGGVRQDDVHAVIDLEGAVVSETPGFWSATVPAAALGEGANYVTVRFEGPGAPSADRRLVTKDTVAPDAPAADLPSGEYDLPQTLHLIGENVRYTTNGSAPGKGSTPFTGPIAITAPRTIKAIAVDAAGNVSEVSEFAYGQKPAPAPQPPAPQPPVVVQPKPEPVVVERQVEIVREVVVEAAPAAPVA
ncbi:MAG TPA: chitobiase/beta-hexosaminidase C-terminal domain-containing protein, partial [Solirubrobacteraceae bacterium]|nr:chitobiase/beta-hexosaminidase C-terminal domain-containing protein [Solirubrobacteraceae bacterium]